MSGNIWVLAEHNGRELADSTLEILGEARRLGTQSGQEVAALLPGHQVSTLVDTLAAYGAGKIHLVEHPGLQNYSTDSFVSAIIPLIEKYKPSIFLCAATALGRDLAPSLAARLNTGLVTNCIILKINGQGSLEMTRDIYRGRVYETRVCSPGQMQMATIKPGVIGLSKPDKLRKAEVIVENLAVDTLPSRTRSKGIIKADPSTVDVSEAEVVVAVGRGVGRNEDFAIIQELSAVISASVGGSRPAVDVGWISYDRQIGQTGKTVAPKLYIACGISGVIQHSMGMKDSRMIVAINNDRGAPIFKLADIGILVDLQQFLPALIEQLRQLKSEQKANLKQQ